MRDVRNRHVVLDTGAVGLAPLHRAARPVLGVALVAVLATGAAAAGAWSAMTAALGGTPRSGPGTLWYDLPQEAGGRAASQPTEIIPAPIPTRPVSTANSGPAASEVGSRGSSHNGGRGGDDDNSGKDAGDDKSGDSPSGGRGSGGRQGKGGDDGSLMGAGGSKNGGRNGK